MGNRAPYAQFRLAASLWASGHDRAAVLPLLRRMAELEESERLWERLAESSEFAEVADDPEFREAAGAGLSHHRS